MKKVAIGICALAVAAAIGTGALVSSASTAEKNSVGAEKALEIALNDAGISKEKAKDKSSVFTKEHGKYVFDVDFEFENKEYDYKIGAKDGSIVDREVEFEDEKTFPETTTEQTTEKETKPSITEPSTAVPSTTSAPVQTTQAETSSPPQTKAETTVSTTQAQTSTPQQKFRISSTEAKRIALKNSGVSESEASFKKVKLKKDDGIYEYEIDFTVGSKEFDYTINALTGEIISKDVDEKHNHNTSVPSTTAPKPTSGFISAADAKKIALSHARLSENEVTFKKFRLERDDGIFQYEVEFQKGSVEYEYEIAAKDGRIITAEKEIDD